MLPEQTSPEVREALEEFHLYLSDVLPPLVVSESFKLLVKYPASLMASNVHSWAGAQYRAGSGIKVSDYLFYAIKKIFLIGEYRLVAREAFAPFLEELKTLILAYSPDSEREALRRNMSRLGESTDLLTASVDALIRGKSAGPPAAPSQGPPMSPEELRLLRRFSLLLERFEAGVAGGDSSEGGKVSDLLTQTIAMAARTSRSASEFEQNLERLGLQMETADVFRTLAAGLPGWPPPPPAAQAGPAAEPAAPPPESAPLAAMRRIVVQPEDAGEVARRFNEMVKTACERFNEGALAQAVTMLELAERIVREKRVDGTIVAAVRHKGDESLDVEWLRRYADTPRQHALLRRVLLFFDATRPTGLFAELLRELKRERRKLILQLLEVHGPPAREEALERLQAPFGKAEGDEKWYFRRNLLYLIRRIPPPAHSGVASAEEVETAVRHAVLKFPAPLVKEAVAGLGQSRHEKAEAALIGLLDQLEKMLLARPADSPYDPRETRLLLEKVVSALARFGTPRARRAVIEHGLKKKTELGNTMARLSELAGQDFSADEDSLERLLTALKANSPRRVLGIVLAQSEGNARHLIDALSTTPALEVKEIFSNLANKFPNLDSGKAAAKALAALESPPPPSEALNDTRSGEMDIFGLPQVVQNLADAGLSGLLKLKNVRGEIDGELALRSGRMKSCEARGLSGEDAFYQLLERPAPATFVFEKQATDSRLEPPVESLPEILPLCLEALRRYDELAQASALVPDEAKFATTQVRPERHPDELDGMLVNGLWKLVTSGATAKECEGAMKVDAYRVRRLLAHWVESGALAIA